VFRFKNQHKLYIASVLAVLIFSYTHIANSRESVVELSKDSIIEFSLFDLKDGMENKFLGVYLPKLKRAIKRNGGRLEGGFETYSIAEGELTPHYVVLIEWPSVHFFDQALLELESEPFTTLKEETIRESYFSLYSTDTDISFELNRKLSYELWFLSFSSPESPSLLNDLFEEVLPFLIDYGWTSTHIFIPIEHPRSNHRRSLAGLSVWPNPGKFYRYYSTNAMQNAIETYRNDAVIDIEIINNRYIRR